MADPLNQMLAKAREAQAAIEFWPQDRVDAMVTSVGWHLYKEENAVACARLAYEETGMGVYEDKLLKHRKKTLGTLRDLAGVKTVGIIEEDPEKGLIKLAKPVGVIGALTPVTNPTSTPAGNVLPILKTRNAVIFAPHPRAKRSAALTTEFIRDGLREVGAPEDLAQSIEEPSVQLSQDLMAAVDLVVATGGSGMVQAAYSSGTPAYGVGTGNAVTIVDDTANVEDAAHKIYLSKVFDNATSCSCENSAVIHESIWDDMIAALSSHGGFLCHAEGRDKLQKTLWPDGAHLNKAIVAQPVAKIAKLGELDVPKGTTFLMVVGKAVGPEDPFCREKLSPVLTLWRYSEFDEAVDLVQRITGYNGPGHSCGIHTQRRDRIVALAEKARVSRIMVRQPQCYANSGNYDNGMPFSMTLGCGTWGGNITSENIHWKHFVNVTWVAMPIEPVVPDEEALFSAHWQRHGQ